MERIAICVLVAAGVLGAAAARGAEELVPFVIPTAPNPASLAAAPQQPPFPADGMRVEARDGHFWRDGKRYRLWGVNLCFGACFPTHAEADRAAARLAQAGINSVRLHHMDMQQFPSGIWDRADPMKLSAEALERLDYFLDQLAHRGICANVNLHVSRTHSQHLRLPREGDMPDFDKVIGIFTPRLIEAQKQYARDLLTHVNAYRKVRYADDPAVAFVEITNEDSLFMWDGEQRLRTLAPYYEKILRGQWSAWLKGRYGSTEALKAAWGKGTEPLGANLIVDGAFALKPPANLTTPRWDLEQHAPAKAAAKALAGTPNAVRLDIQGISGTDWHIQFKNVRLPLKAGRYYTVAFRARGEKPRKISVAVGQDHEPWQNLGLSRGLSLTADWAKFRMGFVATADDDNARLSFIVGGGMDAVELADVLLAPGGQVGLMEGETLEAGNIALFADSEVEARALDRLRFLADTEKRYFDDLRGFVKKDLGAKALVTGTIIFGPAGLYAQSDMDFIDAHSYWHHPNFPGRPWDMGNWVVENVAMTDSRNGGTLPALAADRLAGKPYTVSEYNHSAPMDAQAECVPMIAAFAASQDWDGIWLFSYCHRTNQWDRQHYDSFFDIDANPGKLGFLPAAAVLFRDGGLAPVAGQKVVDLRSDDLLSAFARLALRNGNSMQKVAMREGKLTWPEMLTNRVYASTGPQPGGPKEAGKPIEWTFADGRGRFVAMGERAMAETGWAAGGEAGGKPIFRAVMAAAMDGKPLVQSAAVLIAACGRCENTGMQFSADRRTVGRNWGGPPVRIEPVDHSLRLPAPAGTKYRLQPLAADGTAKGQAAEVALGPGGALPLPARDGTMWWLLSRP